MGEWRNFSPTVHNESVAFTATMSRGYQTQRGWQGVGVSMDSENGQNYNGYELCEFWKKADLQLWLQTNLY